MLMMSLVMNSTNWFCQQKVKEEDSEEEDSTIYTQKHSKQIKMGPLVIHTIKSINYLIELQCQMSNLRIRSQLEKYISLNDKSKCLNLEIKTNQNINNQKWTNLWILCTSHIHMDQGREGKRLSLVNLGTASWRWWIGKLPPGCMADTGQTPLDNEGSCPVCWGEFSTSWPDGEWNKFQISLVILFYMDLKDQDC